MTCTYPQCECVTPCSDHSKSVRNMPTSAATFLGYHDEHGREMHCAWAKCDRPCREGCEDRIAVRMKDGKPELDA